MSSPGEEAEQTASARAASNNPHPAVPLPSEEVAAKPFCSWASFSSLREGKDPTSPTEQMDDDNSWGCQKPLPPANIGLHDAVTNEQWIKE